MTLLRGIPVNISALPTMFPVFLPLSCAFIYSVCNPLSCIGYAPDSFFGERAFSVSKSWFAQAGAGTAFFITMFSAEISFPYKT
jgi:hypothetical protein